MAITSYTELQDAVARWLNRGDLTAVIPDFITLAEAQIARRLRTVTVREGLALNAAEVALPAGCKELRSIRFDTDTLRGPITIATPEILSDHRTSTSGRPRMAAVVDGTLLLNCTPDQSYDVEIIYFSTLSPLSDSNAVNAVLTSAPDLYLFGALKEAEPYMKNDERIALWTSKFEEALASEELSRERSEYGASLRPARIPMVFG